MTRIVSFVILVAVIVVFGVVFYRVMASFLLPLFLAALLVVIFKPLHVRIVQWCRGWDRVAALLTTMAVVLIVLVPLGWISTMSVLQGISLVQQLEVEEVKLRATRFRQRFQLEMPFGDRLIEIDSQLQRLLEDAVAGPPSGELASNQRLEQVDKLLRELTQLRADLSLAAQGNTPKKDQQVPPPVASKALESLPIMQASLETITRDKLYAGDADYLSELQESHAAWQRLREQLLGGPVWTWLREKANPSDEELRQMQIWAVENSQGWLLTATGATAATLVKFLIGLAIVVLAFYYFLVDGPAMIQTLMRLSPLEDEYERQLISEFSKTSRAVVLAMILSAIAQGLLAGVAYWLAGVGSVLLLTMLTMVLAMVPFIGAGAVWFPVCLYLYFVEERTAASVLLLIYGLGIISLADNVVKPMVLHGQSSMHPLLALLSILGGVQAMGPIGIVVGPLAVAFLYSLLDLLQKELARMRSEQASLGGLNEVTDNARAGPPPDDHPENES